MHLEEDLKHVVVLLPDRHVDGALSVAISAVRVRSRVEQQGHHLVFEVVCIVGFILYCLDISGVKHCAGTVQDIAKSKLSKHWPTSVITHDEDDDGDDDDDDGNCHDASHVMLASADGD